jgi:translation initiation factor IF-3
MQNKKKQQTTRINNNIRVPRVLLVRDGKKVGEMPTQVALKLARDADLDLVEVAPNARPPVVSIMDYGKYKYQKDKNVAKKQPKQDIKSIRFRPMTGNHDIETKVKAIRKFLGEGKKVQLVVKFKGKRELSHKDKGFEVIDKVVEGIKDIGKLESRPKMMGDRINCRVEPL